MTTRRNLSRASRRNMAGQRVHTATHTRLTSQVEHEAESFKPPVIAVVPHGRPGRWEWRIKRCPYCGQPHTHGAGSDQEPTRLGHRTAHCLTQTPASRAGYILIAAVPDDAKRDKAVQL